MYILSDMVECENLQCGKFCGKVGIIESGIWTFWIFSCLLRIYFLFFLLPEMVNKQLATHCSVVVKFEKQILQSSVVWNIDSDNNIYLKLHKHSNSNDVDLALWSHGSKNLYKCSRSQRNMSEIIATGYISYIEPTRE